MSTSVSSTPIWGRAYELTVKYASGSDGETTTIALSSNSWEPEALRITFEVLQATIPSPWWFADISVYNLTTPEQQNALVNAVWITLKAGYQTGPNLYSIIWDGPVFQTLLDRENVVDARITFHCVANPAVMDNIVNFALDGPLITQAQLVAQMASNSGLPAMNVANGTMSQAAYTAMQAVRYPRGRGVFGKVGKYITQLADSQFMSSWRDGSKAYISDLSANNVAPALTYTPPNAPDANPQNQAQPGTSVSQTLIGTPRQNPYGVTFEVLLDPRVSVKLPPMVIQLQRTLISQLIVTPGQNLVSPWASNMTFVVAQVRHRGDSRGNDWQTEITGYNTTYVSNLLDGLFSPNSST